MKKDLKDYLHLFGIGCPVSTIDGIGNIFVIHNKAVTVALKCINYNQELHGFSDGNGGLHRTYLLKDDYVKPILRPLSDMTEEEKRMVGFEAYQVLRKDDFGSNVIPSKVVGFMWAAKQTSYLLSKHFDLFGLIESGTCN